MSNYKHTSPGRNLEVISGACWEILHAFWKQDYEPTEDAPTHKVIKSSGKESYAVKRIGDTVKKKK